MATKAIPTIVQLTGAGVSGAPVCRPCAPSGPRSVKDCLACEVRHLALCAALKPDELLSLERIVVGVALPAGKTLFSEGDKADALYHLTDGTMRLVKLLGDGRRQIMGFAFAGDLIGLGVRDGFSSSAEAVDDARLCRFPLKDLGRLFRSFPEMERRLLDTAQRRLASAQDQMLLLGRKSPMEKLASFLLDASARARTAGRPDNPVVLAMSRGDIADFLGLTVETVSRSFSRLKADKVITLPEPTLVRLVDLDRLEELAAGDNDND
jgi:CRP/FNR family transcriptional regulator, anaerobic regulatory protein